MLSLMSSGNFFAATVFGRVEYLKTKTGLEVEPILIQQTIDIGEAEKPITLTIEAKIRNDHMQYAITWFSLAVVISIMLFFFVRNSKSS